MNSPAKFRDHDNSHSLADTKPRSEDYPIIIWDKSRPGNGILLREWLQYGGAAWWVDSEPGKGRARTPRIADNEPVVIFAGSSAFPSMTIEWEDARWSPLKRDHYQHEEPAKVCVGRSRAEEHEQYLAKLTEELHQLADDNNWCSDFDRIMEEVGLLPRTVQMRVSVRVEFVAVMQSPSAEQDEWLSRQIGVDVEADRVQIEGSAVIDLYRDGIPDEEPEIDLDEVYETLEHQMESTLDEVVDFSVEGYERVD